MTDVENRANTWISRHYSREEDTVDYHLKRMRRFSVWIQPPQVPTALRATLCSRTRHALSHTLHSFAANVTIIVLASLDAVILVTVMLLEIEALKVGPGVVQNKLEDARFGLECVSLIIISLFMIEIVLKIFAVGLKRFFTHCLETLDAVVTFVSLVLDAFVIADHVHHMRSGHKAEHRKGSSGSKGNTGGNVRLDAFEAAAILLIFLRLWRVVRIVNATMVSIHIGLEAKMLRMKEEEIMLLQRIAQLEEYIKESHLPLPKLSGDVRLHNELGPHDQ
ncbi:Voltage-gated hydrogen channel 1 [Paragonimus heterotremus]|uniref:Voltage-gated hydrogen channel 1 n=1 Tax=Paragonimus heterotremus TaxID=100268 RepID=A0A8J4SNX4_9TREM|nr:Voltage-gated hydrogen channel 1 [Paragonimus heterotremus]